MQAKIARAKKKQTRPIIVELGNAGLALQGEKPNTGVWANIEKPAERTKKHARKMPNAIIIGIDLRRIEKPLPKNVKQKTADLLEGLQQLKNSSVSRIESYMSIGYYGMNGMTTEPGIRGRNERIQKIKQYTKKLLDTAYEKLLASGKLIIVAGKDAILHTLTTLEQTKFDQTKIKCIELKPSKKRGTYWTRRPIRGETRPRYKIIAKK